jgi:hypothetical protein
MVPQQLIEYFQGEKNAALFVSGVATVTMVAAAALWPARFGLRSMSVTLGVLALVLLAVGVGLYFKTDPQVDRLLAQLGSDAPAFYAAETARMEKVQRNFVIIEWVEIVVIVVGAIAAIALKARPGVGGVAMALVAVFAFLLAFDIVAERRGAVYLRALAARALTPI